MKKPLLILMAAFAAAPLLRAQAPDAPAASLATPLESVPLAQQENTPAASGAAARNKKGGSPATRETERPPGATEITSTEEASFDDKARKAVFTGNVRVKDPQFTLRADRLTVFIKREAITGATTKPEATAAATPASNKGSGLERAIAEGHVEIMEDKPDAGAESRYIAKAGRAEFNAETGDMILTNWPQVQQGINLHVATEASTVMIINRDGRLQTRGSSRTLIQEPEKSEKNR